MSNMSATLSNVITGFRDRIKTNRKLTVVQLHLPRSRRSDVAVDEVVAVLCRFGLHTGDVGVVVRTDLTTRVDVANALRRLLDLRRSLSHLRMGKI